MDLDLTLLLMITQIHCWYIILEGSETDPIHDANISLIEDKLYILFPAELSGVLSGVDPLAFMINSTLRPYVEYTPITFVPASGINYNINTLTINPSDDSHDVEFLSTSAFDFAQLDQAIRINGLYRRGFFFNANSRSERAFTDGKFHICQL